MARRRGAFWHDADCTYAFNALEKTRHRTNAIGKNGATDNELVVTGYSVRLAGFGYIIVATYLPLMAKDAGSPLLTAHLWTLVGLSIVPGLL